MTLAQWLDSRTPAGPPRLRARLHAAIRPWADAHAADAPELCLRAAEDVLRDLLSDATGGRGRALDLLAADALVTYAFEAASEHPEVLARRAELAMERLSKLHQGIGA